MRLKVPVQGVPVQILGICVECHHGFIVSRVGQKYCSERCRVTVGFRNQQAKVANASDGD